MSDQLPKGWAATTLGDLLNFKYGKGLPQERRNGKGSVNVYGSNGIVGLHNAAVTSGPTIIVGRKGSVGEVHLSTKGCWPIDTTYFVDEFPSNVPPGYWALYLRSLRLGQQEKSSAIPGISRDDIYAVEVPVPPLPEQRRIVAKLDALMAKVDTCQQRLAKIPLLLKRFRQSVLAAACSARLTADWREDNPADDHPEEAELPGGWKPACVGEVVEGLKYGTAQKCSYEKRGAPVLRIPNVANGIIDKADLKYAILPPKEFEHLKLTPGDILLIRSNGSVSLVGKSALVRETEAGFAYAGYLIRLRPNRALVRPEFLNMVLASYGIRAQIELEARSTSGVNNINSEEVRALRLSLPGLAEQHEIVRRVEALFALADQIETRFTKAQQQVDKLTPSLLAKAFRGDLVPQDPNDEPASELLERIKTGHAGSRKLSKQRS